MKTNEEHTKVPGTCPRCGSDNAEWYGFDVVDGPNDGAEAHQEACCMDCSFCWDDVYTLTGFVYCDEQDATTCTITGKPEPADDLNVYDMMAKAINEGTPDPHKGKSDLFNATAMEAGIPVIETRLSENPNWEDVIGFIETVKEGWSK